ncbi:MAG TPA: ADP-forming succinate--CoA ligase subunit beta [Firmicutes bacterium]|nr:ADP-forming succinate--CoA ligase subunit beta [Bacillota bacterium]
MKLYEYLGKQLFDRYGIPVPRGKMVKTAGEAAEVAAEWGEVVIKSQVLTGKRGKAGGIAFATDSDQAGQEASRILSMKIQGLPVEMLLVEEKLSIDQELYLAITVDGAARSPIILASLDGGMEVEEVPPERMIRWPINVNIGAQQFAVREICRRLGVTGSLQKQLLAIVPKLYSLFRELDAELVEINPLALCGQELVAADAKITIDDDALYRHKDLPRITEKTSLELKAEELGLAFVELGGEIAVMANGAGITMATLDMVQHYGGTPANFLDMGGGADLDRTANALELLLATDPRVILINIFGGITRCDVVAGAFARVKENRGIELPVSFRLVGTNEEQGRAILERMGVSAFHSMDEAIRHAVGLCSAQS